LELPLLASPIWLGQGEGLRGGVLEVGVDWSAIWADIQQNWWIYLSMPVIAAFIGYVTKLLAVWMMFNPIEFKGLRYRGRKTPLGWQGMIPARAGKMAGIAYDTLTDNILDFQELISRLDPQDIVRELREPLNEAVEDLTEELMAQYQPDLWEALPGPARRLLISRVQQEAPKVFLQLAEELTRDVHAVIDLKHMVVSTLVRDKEILNRLVKEVAEPEMRFIVRSGVPFGFAIGCVQALAYALTKSPLIMPIFGFSTGWITDFVALNMLFRPREPVKLLGITIHGRMHMRRDEIAPAYGDLIAKEILTPRNMLEAMLTGPKSDKLLAMVDKEVRKAIDEQTGILKPLVVLALGGRKYQELKAGAVERVLKAVPETAESMFAYTEQALDIRGTIAEKMAVLPPEKFENILRPAFKEDEKYAIAVGAILGGVIGELQAFLLIHLPHLLG
jgi:uncharacterized membrane protein YheB (UPF0754 family)